MVLVHVGEPGDAVALADTLFRRGVFAPPIRPPTVPEGKSRLRLTPMATHSVEEIDRAIDAFPEPEEARSG